MISGEGSSFVEAGYPTSGKTRLAHGWSVPLGGSTSPTYSHNPSALIQKDGGVWYWVPSYFWGYYESHGGPGGHLGYPTSWQQSLGNGQQQLYEYGCLFSSGDTGVLTCQQYRDYKAGRLNIPPMTAPQTPSASTPLGRMTQTAPPDTLNSGASLGGNQTLVSANGLYTLIMQTDGDLVIYGPGHKRIWSSGTTGSLYAVFANQSDGNMVVIAQGNRPACSFDTEIHPHSRIAMQSDGALVVYAPGRGTIWNSRQGGQCRAIQ
jgi:hypothetical protein